MDDLISRQASIDALWKALHEYEDKTEKQFQESKELDVQDWIQHRVFVQNMNDIDRKTILALPSAQRKGKWIMHIDDLFPVESTMECSKCHHEQSLIIDDNFCPNCGAEMKGEEDEVN